MKTTAFPSHWIFLAYLVLTFYCLGAAVMNEFVEYQSWADLGSYLSAADFAAWHVATAQHTMPFLTVPAVLLSVVLLLLCWQRPPAIPRLALWLALACHVLFWASTVLVQWPLEGALGQGQFSPDLMERLLRSDWVRKVLLLLEAPVAVYMAHRVLRPVRGDASPHILLPVQGAPSNACASA
ncbi:hypothetical protein EJV47_01415 [Hymenobacter gummosus]|uniref:DUF1772 domain-containing protein n=1 Tax=Hymenobacter gummosus TaxID=1776032 RepID=A0A431U9A6_9BACT|nr:hypothetical protein [Hymenobacter gummosus]RTQ53426.1 hypothetical protein EJV47_01415 [Hymenobacter gummosus]